MIQIIFMQEVPDECISQKDTYPETNYSVFALLPQAEPLLQCPCENFVCISVEATVFSRLERVY